MAVRSALCTVFAITGWWCSRHSGLPSSVATAMYMVAYLFGAWDMALETWEDLKELKFDTHFLMLTVVPATAAVGAWGEGALLLILFSASAAMEAFAMGRTQSAIDALLRGAPKTATVLTDAGPRELSVEELTAGQTVRVPAGQQIPVDLRITEGDSACDESSLTGESTPIDKARGDLALAGTVNLHGVLTGTVVRPASESALQRVIRLIQHSQSLRAPSQRLADRFGTRYTGLVLGLCGIMFLWWWKGESLPAFFPAEGKTSAFYRTITLLTVMSPCALVISVPAAILSAIAAGARRGVLFRGGAAVEKLALTDVVAMDKTGTLTEGDPKVEHVETLSGTEAEAIAAAASLAVVSTHPLSRALTKYADTRGIVPGAVENVETIPGKGIRGMQDGAAVWQGSRALLADAGIPLPETAAAHSGTEVWVHRAAGRGPAVTARFILKDQMRPQSPGLVRELHAQGVRTVMLTGDRSGAAEEIGRQSGIGEVRAGLSPADKVAALQELKSGGRSVAMVGDGINDAPSLAAADVGIAMGARGSDAALEQADIVLMADRLENVLVARRLSASARRIIRQNIILSLGTIIIMTLATLLPLGVPLALGVAAHEGSTALVVLNSLRLLLLRKE